MSHLHRIGDGRVFVFGSNMHGIHGRGGAAYARMLGAVAGRGEGPMPDAVRPYCYALPTCRAPGEPLELYEIIPNVDAFLAYARSKPELRFFVSRVGCGYARKADAHIAPMFRLAPDNCDLPPGWR